VGVVSCNLLCHSHSQSRAFAVAVAVAVEIYARHRRPVWMSPLSLEQSNIDCWWRNRVRRGREERRAKQPQLQPPLQMAGDCLLLLLLLLLPIGRRRQMTTRSTGRLLE